MSTCVLGDPSVDIVEGDDPRQLFHRFGQHRREESVLTRALAHLQAGLGSGNEIDQV